MSKKQRSKQQKKQQTTTAFSWSLIPVLLILGILPLITRVVICTSYVKEVLYNAAPEENFDVFLYAKAVFLMIVAGVMVVLLVRAWFADRNWPKLKAGFIPLGIYALLVCLSSLLSEHTRFSLGGIDEGYESMFVLLSYCVLSVYVYVMVRREEDIRQIFRWWPIGIAILIFIGITQLIGHDFWATGLGKKLLLPISQWGAKLSFNFEDGRIYLSQYNPNYVGPLAVMIILLFGSLAIFTKEKKRRLIFGGVTIGMLGCLLGSQSKNGMIALFLGGILLCLFLHKKLKKYWYVFLGGFVVVITLIAALDISRDHFIVRSLKASWKSLTGVSEADDRNPRLEEIQAGDEFVEITYDGNQLFLKGNLGEDKKTMSFELYDQDQKRLTYSYDGESETASIDDVRFEGIQFKTGQIKDVICICVIIDGYTWRFTDQVGQKGYYYASPNGVYTKMQQAETAVFTNMPSLASGRGYIWARTIPMLKDTIFLGRGADNFRIYFPQYDYVNAYKSGFAAKNVCTPHNMFLQIGVNTGVLSLLAFLGFYIMYFVDCLRLYWKEEFSRFLPQVGLGVCVATFAYMMTGFLNDSMVCVAPVFWCLMGLGLAVNRMYKKEMRK